MKFSIPGTIPRAALITGGAQQPGIARALAEAGFAIALQYHPGVEADLPAHAVRLPADLSDETQTASLLDRAAAALGPIGVLVNAASTLGRDTWDGATRATWDMHIETNLRAPFLLIQHFAKALPPPHEGVVINLLDQRICPHLVSYTLSKAALWTLTQTMALALAPRIRVNGIVPGGIVLGGIAAGPALRLARDRATRLPDQGTGPDAIGQAALAILALSSMTGQMIVPDGVPPHAE
jgi:NAD(P)-dependent dehydrogenase (short-subunit alcohol dehydrogenase family)